MLPTAHSEAEIRQELFISYHTVHSHVRTIYRKLGTQLTRARAAGLLPTPLALSAPNSVRLIAESARPLMTATRRPRRV
jgi:Bacterial regulatory proteins, luxR family